MQDLLPLLAKVSPVAWGILSALSFGVADFVARFTSRKIGHHASLFFTLLIGVVVFTITFFTQTSFSKWSNTGALLVAVHGVAFAFSLLLLYRVLARGPINIVTPIVAAHPLFIIALAFVLGSRPSAGQWLAVIAILLCIIVITSASPGVKEKTDAGDFLRKTIALSILTSVIYALNVATAQYAVAIFGEFSTLWFGHLIAFSVLLFMIKGKMQLSGMNGRWWCVLMLQGILNASGTLFLFAGSVGAFPELTALLSSEFAVVTIILAAIFLRERMNGLQTLAVLGVFVASGYLLIAEN